MNVFSETKGLEAHCRANAISGVEIIKNPKTGKLFVSFSNGETARLAKDVTSLKGDLSVSYFTPEEGDASWMIHRTGESANVVDAISFATAPEFKVG
jgi:hypothetical protein